MFEDMGKWTVERTKQDLEMNRNNMRIFTHFIVERFAEALIKKDAESVFEIGMPLTLLRILNPEAI